MKGRGRLAVLHVEEMKLGLKGNRYLFCVGAIAVVVSIWFWVGSAGFALDDAWIHLAYAKSLILGDGLSYNPEDYETGYTSPLWILLITSFSTQKKVVLFVKILGLLLHAFTAVLAALLTTQLGTKIVGESSWKMGFLSGALVALSPMLVHSATSGMEVPLATATLTGAVVAIVFSRWKTAFFVSALAVLTRPEALIPLFVFPLTLFVFKKDWRVFIVALGAVAGQGLSTLLLFVVSGYPLPNTYYIKAGGGFGSLPYLASELLPRLPWVVSITGILLLALGLTSKEKHCRYYVLASVMAFIASLLAVAFSRRLSVGVQFWHWRYLAPFLVFPLSVLPLGLSMMKPGIRTLLVVVPIFLVAIVSLTMARTAQHQQAEDTHELHEMAAIWITDNLPKNSVVAVEAAGASRYFTPREMRIVDIVGLNDREIAHNNLLGAILPKRHLTHLVIPSEWFKKLDELLGIRPLVTFEDPHSVQVLPPHKRTLVIAEVVGSRVRNSFPILMPK